MEAGGSVVLLVLECVDDVEACDPCEDHGGDGVDRGCCGECLWVDGDGGGDGAESEGGAEGDVAEECEAFGEGVEGDECECWCAEDERPGVLEEGVEGCGEGDEEECGGDCEGCGVFSGETSCGDGAVDCSWVVCVEVCVSPSVDEHGPCSCGDHAEYDECELG